MNSNSSFGILVVVFLLILSGCASNRGVVKKGPITEVVSTEMLPLPLPVNESPMTILDSSSSNIAKLDGNAFVKLGVISIQRLTEACFKGDCKNYGNHVDTTASLLAKAAESGGSHVILDLNNQRHDEGVNRDSDRCADSGIGIYTSKIDASGNYIAIGSRVSEYEYCNRWEKDYGNGKWVKSSGTIWRFDPKLAEKINKAKGDVNKLIVAYTSDKENCNSKYGGEKACCGYKNLIMDDFVIEPISRGCYPFYKSNEGLDYPDHAAVFTLHGDTNYSTHVYYIINNSGEVIKQCEQFKGDCDTNRDPQCYQKIEEDPKNYCKEVNSKFKLKLFR